MKKLCVCLFLLSCFHLFSQNDSITRPYPYQLISGEEIHKIEDGNYVFKEQIDYFNLRILKNDNMFLEPVFFDMDDFGIIIQRTLPAGQYMAIDSVIQSVNNIIVHIKLVTSNRGDSYRNIEHRIFMRVPASNKEILFKEEEGEYILPPHTNHHVILCGTK